MASSIKADFGIITFCVIGAAEWWFLSIAPSVISMAVMSLLLTYLFLAFCLLAVLLPAPGAEDKGERFVPLPQAETYRPKALTL